MRSTDYARNDFYRRFRNDRIAIATRPRRVAIAWPRERNPRKPQVFSERRRDARAMCEAGVHDYRFVVTQYRRCPRSTEGSGVGLWRTLTGMPRKLAAAVQRNLFADDDTDASAAPGARGMPQDLRLALDADAVAHGVPLEPRQDQSRD